MSWDDYRRRRDTINAVLVYAAEHPETGLPFDEVPQVAEHFADRRSLVLALQYDWTQALWARIELLSLESGRNGRFFAADELAEAAWTYCSGKHPVLRRLLDAYRDELGPCVAREQELLRLA
jgi:hypothetical protein